MAVQDVKARMRKSKSFFMEITFWLECSKLEKNCPVMKVTDL